MFNTRARRARVRVGVGITNFHSRSRDRYSHIRRRIQRERRSRCIPVRLIETLFPTETRGTPVCIAQQFIGASYIARYNEEKEGERKREPAKEYAEAMLTIDISRFPVFNRPVPPIYRANDRYYIHRKIVCELNLSPDSFSLLGETAVILLRGTLR